jgi:hypothetical protein
MLSFLPAQAAVQTCVLARRWRHLWRSTTSLRIVGLAEDEKLNVKDLRKFVDHLLILRERTNLGTVEIKFSYFCEEDQPYVQTWVRFAVMNKVRALTLSIDSPRSPPRQPASCLSVSENIRPYKCNPTRGIS